MLSKLTDANAHLASATSLQYQAIKKLLTEIKHSNSSPPALGGAEATDDPSIFNRILKKSYSFLIIGGADAGVGA